MGSGCRLYHLLDCSRALWGSGQNSLFQEPFDYKELFKYPFFSLVFAGGQTLSFKLKHLLLQHSLQELRMQVFILSR